MADLHSLTDLSDRLNRADARALFDRADISKDTALLAAWAERYGRAALEAAEDGVDDAEERRNQLSADEEELTRREEEIDRIIGNLRQHVADLKRSWLSLSGEAPPPAEFDEIEEDVKELEQA